MKCKNSLEEDADALFLKASKSREREDFQIAFDLFMEGAKSGHEDCQFMAGYMYDVGEGIGQNLSEALYWYKKSCRKQKYGGAYNNIAIIYEELGEFIKANYFWKKAIQVGDVEALFESARYLLKRRRFRKSKVVTLLKKYILSEEAFQYLAKEAKDLLQILQSDKAFPDIVKATKDLLQAQGFALDAIPNVNYAE
jgi:TPR repeat protein